MHEESRSSSGRTVLVLGSASKSIQTSREILSRREWAAYLRVVDTDKAWLLVKSEKRRKRKRDGDRNMTFRR